MLHVPESNDLLSLLKFFSLLLEERMLEAATAAGEVTVLTLLSGGSVGSSWLGRFFQCLDLAVDRRRLTGDESSSEILLHATHICKSEDIINCFVRR